MNAKELRALPAEELKSKITELKGTLFELRMQLKTGRLDSTADLQKTRKEIARASTVLRELELGIGR